MDDSNDNPMTRRTARKKMVDLKAVAALLDDSHANQGGSVSSIREGNNPQTSTYSPNEELIQETARIKSQRDLIQQRVQKMETNRSRVSRNVFDKVSRDYAMQLQSINELLNEKKSLLNRELKNLYMQREKLTIDINRHKEILEEAQFRNYLGEFSTDQYKEVEEYESREIQRLQGEIAKIHSFVKLHEELFDPEDLGLPKKPPSPPLVDKMPVAPQAFVPEIPPASIEPTRTMVAPPVMQPPRAPTQCPKSQTSEIPAPEASLPFPPVESTEKKPSLPDFLESTPLPQKEAAQSLESAPVLDQTAKGIKTTAPADETPYQVPPEKSGYFDEISEPSLQPMPGDKPLPPPLPSAAPEASAKSKEEGADSILDILNELPLEEISLTENKEAQKQVSSQSLTPQPHFPESSLSIYKLIFVEGDSQIPDVRLGENVSIGRSPSNDLVLPAAKVSRQHAAINKYKDRYILIDLKSSNGVFVNGRKIDEHTLEEGDEISISGYRFVFKKE